MKSPAFIVVEGLDGSGKSTQAILLADKLRRDTGKTVHLTAQPSKGVVGRFIRSEVLTGRHEVDEHTTCYLFAADRQHHLITEIEPALARGELVVCDRYLPSTLAYQAASDTGPSIEEVMAIHGRFRKPDLTVYLQISPELAMERLQGRTGVKERYEELGRLETIHKAYEAIVNSPRFHHQNFTVVDGSGSTVAVAERIWRAVAERIWRAVIDWDNKLVKT